MILDEPLARLDPELMRALARDLRRAAAGRTCLALTHAPDILNTDVTLFLVEGRLDEAGSHDELMRRNPRCAALVSRAPATEALSTTPQSSVSPRGEMRKAASCGQA